MEKTWTVAKLLNETRKYFRNKGISTPRLDAEILLSHVLQLERVQLYMNFDRPLTRMELSGYRNLVRRRAAREPVAYITGNKEFWSIPLKITADVLIPRPDTEILVETVLEILHQYNTDRPARILEIGTGSGAISTALAHSHINIKILATDISLNAVLLAKQNIYRYHLEDRVQLMCADAFAPLKNIPFFDLVVSNPPYIPSGAIDGLAPEITKFEPRTALDGGDDGIDFYRNICNRQCINLRPGGFVVVEIGSDQGEKLCQLFAECGLFSDVEIKKDYSGHDRVVLARKKQGKAI